MAARELDASDDEADAKNRYAPARIDPTGELKHNIRIIGSE
jgi:hypothetical protein